MRLSPRPIVKTILTIALIVAITFGLVEVGARYWLSAVASDEQYIAYGTLMGARDRGERTGRIIHKFEPHRYLGYIGTANFERGMNRHNAYGYRGADFPVEKPGDEFRIVCIGGSTTYTSIIDDASLAYPEQLERALHQQGYPNVRVINAGLPGWSSIESLINLQLRVLDFDPDLIIAYHGVNDVVARLVFPYKFYALDNRGHRTDSPGWNVEMALWDRSVASRIVRVRLFGAKSELTLENAFGARATSSRFWQFTAQVGKGTYPRGLLAKHPVRELLAQNTVEAFERNMLNIVLTARAHGAQTVLTTFAVDTQSEFPPLTQAMRHPEFVAGIEEQNDVLRAMAASQDVPLFDFAAVFPRDQALFFDPVHVNAKGAGVKARLFAEYLLSQGLIPAPVSSAVAR